jgi:hypothetical protein
MARSIFLFCVLILNHLHVSAQSIEVSSDFRLGSPFSEPDGRNDVVKLPSGDLVLLAKMKGSETGKADFSLECVGAKSLNLIWQKVLSIEPTEDFKELYFNGTEIILLSVLHQEALSKTSLLAYAYNVNNGELEWKKELEQYTISPWVEATHRGKVKESFIDVICEHTTPGFVTPFEYKHHIHFSPDQSKFVSTVFQFGSASLKAQIAVYSNKGDLLYKGVVSIDNDYTNYGVYVNNQGVVYILNANAVGHINCIRFNLDTKEYVLLQLESSNLKRDDLMLHFDSDNMIRIAFVTQYNDVVKGCGAVTFNFDANQVGAMYNITFDESIKNKITTAKIKNKAQVTTEDFKEYDLSHVFFGANNTIDFILEKRALYADGYPHITASGYDKSHVASINGHVQAEGILMLSASPTQVLWSTYIYKNQVYTANDGLNTVSYVIDAGMKDKYRIIYANPEGLSGSMVDIEYLEIDPTNGKIINQKKLPNDAKLSLVRDYTVWEEGNKLILVGRKGVLGKASSIVKYSF